MVGACIQAAEHLTHAESVALSQTSSDAPIHSSMSSQQRELSQSQPVLAAAVLTRFAKRGQALTVAQSIWQILGSPADTDSNSRVRLLQHLLCQIKDSQALEKILGALLLEAPSHPSKDPAQVRVLTSGIIHCEEDGW